MYLIDKSSNRIKQLEKKTFSQLGFKERKHLQEWLAHQPSAFGEELLIIQKEFSGFEDTNERLDLLALDTDGNLVIIENKLDDSGKDVTWQVLKYASYCSTLSKAQIISIYQDFLNKEESSKNAEENLKEFFKRDIEEISLNKRLSQRIFIVSANFKKEITSNVLWLLDYKIRIKCFTATPYSLGDQLFLSIEQIIPIKDESNFIIRMTDKMQEDISAQETLKDRHKLRLEFWQKLLPRLKGKTPIFQNTSPSKESWVNSGGLGIGNIRYNLVVTNNYASVVLEFARSSQDENKKLFDKIELQKKEIEQSFGKKLEWNRMSDKISSRISYTLNGVSLYNPDNWSKIMDFMVTNIILLEKTMRAPLNDIKSTLNASFEED